MRAPFLHGGGTGGSIGVVTSPGTEPGEFDAGSILFSDADGNITEDPTNLFYDDTNDRVHIGPRAGQVQTGKLNVYHATARADLTLTRAQSGVTDELGAVQFWGRDSAAVSQLYAQIIGKNTDATAGSEDGQIRFETAVAGSVDARAILDGADLLLGTTTNLDAGVRLQVVGAASEKTAIFRANATTPGNIIEAQDSAGVPIFGTTTTQVRVFGTSTAATPGLSIGDTSVGFFRPAVDTLGFATAGVEAMRIDSSQVVTAQTGIKTGTTQAILAPGMWYQTAGPKLKFSPPTGGNGFGWNNGANSLELVALLDTGEFGVGLTPTVGTKVEIAAANAASAKGLVVRETVHATVGVVTDFTASDGTTRLVAIGRPSGTFPGLFIGSDVIIYRPAANVLKTDDTIVSGIASGNIVPVLLKAGVPADGDFVETPSNGTLAVNTTANKIYCRIAGVWTDVGGV